MIGVLAPGASVGAPANRLIRPAEERPRGGDHEGEPAAAELQPAVHEPRDHARDPEPRHVREVPDLGRPVVGGELHAAEVAHDLAASRERARRGLEVLRDPERPAGGRCPCRAG